MARTDGWILGERVEATLIDGPDALGTVIRINPVMVHVRMDTTGRVLYFNPELIRRIS